MARKTPSPDDLLAPPGPAEALPVASTLASTVASPVAAFEASMESLEALVARMEDGDLSLEDQLAAYERGVALFRGCQQALEQAELRVRLVSDPAHPASAQPFPDLPAGDA